LDRISASEGIVWEDIGWLLQKIAPAIQECAIFLPQRKIKMEAILASM
jgi:hypothetical protein